MRLLNEVVRGGAGLRVRAGRGKGCSGPLTTQRHSRPVQSPCCILTPDRSALKSTQRGFAPASGAVIEVHVAVSNFSLQRTVIDKVLSLSAGGRPAELER